jgi:hypothetical protein
MTSLDPFDPYGTRICVGSVRAQNLVDTLYASERSVVFDQAMWDRAGWVTDYGALTLRDLVSYWLACWRGRARNRRPPQR